MNHLKEYSLLTANKIGGDVSTKYTVSTLQIFDIENGVSKEELQNVRI